MSPRSARFLAALFVGLILVGTLMPGPAKHSLLSHFPPGLHIDKLGHVVGFLVMAYFAVRSRIARARPSHVLWFALCLGAMTELCQNLIPGRTPLVTDVMIDFTGALVGVWQASRYAPARPSA